MYIAFFFPTDSVNKSPVFMLPILCQGLLVSLDHNDHGSSHGRFRLSDMQHLRPNPAGI